MTTQIKELIQKRLGFDPSPAELEIGVMCYAVAVEEEREACLESVRELCEELEEKYRHIKEPKTLNYAVAIQTLDKVFDRIERNAKYRDRSYSREMP